MSAEHPFAFSATLESGLPVLLWRVSQRLKTSVSSGKGSFFTVWFTSIWSVFHLTGCVRASRMTSCGAGLKAFSISPRRRTWAILPICDLRRAWSHRWASTA
jgi:hypothetical protein